MEKLTVWSFWLHLTFGISTYCVTFPELKLMTTLKPDKTSPPKLFHYFRESEKTD